MRRDTLLYDCFERHGVEASQSTRVIKASGEKGAIGYFLCAQSYRIAPLAPRTDEQLGWLYDYLAGYLTPLL